MKKFHNWHICKNCRFYDVLYKVSVCEFQKQDIGICLQKQEYVQKNFQCELYKYRPQKEKVITLDHIDEVIEDIEKLDKIFNNGDF